MPNYPQDSYPPEFTGLINSMPTMPRQSRADMVLGAVAPYLRDTTGAPMPPPGTPPGKIGPPSGPPTGLGVAAGMGSDALQSLATGTAGKLGMGMLGAVKPTFSAIKGVPNLGWKDWLSEYFRGYAGDPAIEERTLGYVKNVPVRGDYPYTTPGLKGPSDLYNEMAKVHQLYNPNDPRPFVERVQGMPNAPSLLQSKAGSLEKSLADEGVRYKQDAALAKTMYGLSDKEVKKAFGPQDVSAKQELSDILAALKTKKPKK